MMIAFRRPNIGKWRRKYSKYLIRTSKNVSEAPIRTLFGTLAGRTDVEHRYAVSTVAITRPLAGLLPREYPICSESDVTTGIRSTTRLSVDGIRKIKIQLISTIAATTHLYEPLIYSINVRAIRSPSPVVSTAAPIIRPPNTNQNAPE